MTSTVIKYVGRTTNFKGKTLWEIIGSLKNQGIGRLVVRSVFQRYEEPTYMKIVKVESCPDEERRRVRVWAELTFRGNTLPKLREIYRTSYKPDYQLVPKNEEHKLLENKKVHNVSQVVLPSSVEMPKLMQRLIAADRSRKGLEPLQEYKIPLTYNSSTNRLSRVAKDGETPTVEITMGLGKPASPSLYEGVSLN